MSNVARRTLWFVAVPLAALAGGYAGFFPVFTMGLTTPMYLVGPLAVLTGALLATLFAGWLANLLAWGESRSRLLSVLGLSSLGLIAGLAAGAVLGRLLYSFAPFRSLWPALAGWVLAGVVFAAVTAASVWRLRRTLPTEGGGLGAAGARALGLSLAWAVALPLDETLAYQLGLVGAGYGPVIPVGTVLWVSVVMAAAGATLLIRGRPRRSGRRSGFISSLQGGALGRDAAPTLLLTGLTPALVVGVLGVWAAS